MLREPFMVKQEYIDLDLTLEAEAGKSLLVKDIIVINPAAATQVTVSIDKDTVGYFRATGTLGSHLGMAMGNVQYILTAGVPWALGYKTILGLLFDKGIFRGYPIGEGQKLTISGPKQADCLQMVVYEEHDAGDITPEMPNGTKSTEYEFLNYGRVAATIAAAASTIYAVAQSPAQFPDFPFAKDVPAGHEIQLHGILASDVFEDQDSGDDLASDYLKLVRGRTTLFDIDKNGLFLKGVVAGAGAAAVVAQGRSIIGNFSDVDHKPPFILDPPITFLAGEELGVYLTTSEGASLSVATLLAEETEIALIERVIKL